MPDDHIQLSTPETGAGAEPTDARESFAEALEPTPTSDAGTPNENTDSQTSSTTDPDSTLASNEAGSASPSSTPWQAIFSPQYGAYYFYNAETQQTTWENPLLPATTSSSAQGHSDEPESQQEPADAAITNPGGYSAASYAAMQAAAVAAGIDPSLAHLDPSLASLPASSTGPTAHGLPPTFTAKFNARTGQFTRPDGRDPSHLSEHARAARMSEFYFDVNAWEQQLAEQGGSIQGLEEGRKRKRPTKKDLERFKEQKRLKKIAKTAWLRT